MLMKRTPTLLLLFLICIAELCSAQKSDSTTTTFHVSGAAYLTNNGISLVPSFSLGRPAVMVLMSLGGKKVSFDPDIRFSLDGKPWVMLFWARYKPFREGKFRLNTGVHLGLNYRTSTVDINNTPVEANIVRRYLAAELAPNYFVAKNISIGAYILSSLGVDNGTVRNTHFITLNSNFSHIPIVKKVYLGLVPQVFYLSQDGNEGLFFTATFTLAKKNFPLSISAIINKELRSTIPGGKDFIWNLSLVYSFNKNYVPKTASL